MIFEQFYLECLSHASYLIGDQTTGDAVVVDPQRDIGPYLEAATSLDLHIKYVVLTHFHADFVSGHLELAEKTGATILMGAKAETEYAMMPVRDGNDLSLGKVRLQFLETPGHTPESISVVVYETADAEPFGVLTGDALFVGDVGRPDLLASLGYTKDQLGEMLYDSLHNKLMQLPDNTRVFPAHGAGSMCGKNLGTERSTTIGIQKQLNYALQPMSKEMFLGMVTQDQPTAPRYFVHDAITNRKVRHTLSETLKHADPLTAEETLTLMAKGQILLDTRDPDFFSMGHVLGSINVGLDGKYATWVGSVVRPEENIIVLTEPGREIEAMTRLGRIGYDNITGFVSGGFEAFPKEQITQIPRLEASILPQEGNFTFLDVREPSEFALGTIPGSRNISLKALRENMDDLPKEDVIVFCAGGYRSSVALSLLTRAGIKARDLRGGYAAWVEAQPKTETQLS